MSTARRLETPARLPELTAAKPGFRVGGMEATTAVHTFPVRMLVSCPTCGGEGEVNPQGLRHTAETCPRCHGNLHVDFVPEARS